MTPALLLFVVAVVAGAIALDGWLWRRFASVARGFWETAASISVLWFAIAIAMNWSLSWLGALDRVPLIVAAVLLLALSAIALRRNQRIAFAHTGALGTSIFFLTPLLLWLAFVLWRGVIVPVLSHDALSYHMPKAVMLARAHRYLFFQAPDPRIPTSPANYEMLLADMLLLAKSDAFTEWIGTASYVALLLLAAALVERWWGNGPQVVVTILLVASVPVILLHAGAHKNDLLSNVFYLGALLWGGRWLAGRETAPLVLALVSLAAAGGTKVHGVFVAVALVCVFTWQLVRGRLHLTRAQLLVIAASVPVALFLLGGWAYALNLIHTGELAQPASSTSAAGYGDWHNVWEVPAFMLLRSVQHEPVSIFVPWRGERWYWPRDEIYFSHYGFLVTVLAVLLPFAIASHRRFGTGAMQRERMLTSIAALIAFVLMLPVRLRPLGFFGGFPRYFCFIAVFVIAWTAALLVAGLQSHGKARMVKLALAAAALLFAGGAVFYAIADRFQPLTYVMEAAANRGMRRPSFAIDRAGTVVDGIAGPNDTIAVHSGFDSWIYPMYGEKLSRTLVFVETGTPIPADADYIVIDRAWSTIWGHPRFEHMGQYKQYLGNGIATDEDLAIIRELERRPDEFEPIYEQRHTAQAIFRRRSRVR